MKKTLLKYFSQFSLVVILTGSPFAWAQKLNPDDCISITSNDTDSEYLTPYRKLDHDIQRQFNRFHHQNDGNDIIFKVENDTILLEKISFGKNFTEKDIPIEKGLQTAIMKHRSKLENGRCYIGYFYNPSIINLTGQAGKAVIWQPVKTTAFILALPVIIPIVIIQSVLTPPRYTGD